jgi:hypothetical protein
VNCDDYGRFDARPAIINGRLFPLKSVTEKQIVNALNKLSTVGIVLLYEYDGRPYLQFVTWENHQQIRSKRSKFPEPDSTCNQMISYDIKCSRNPIQSESNPNPIQSEEDDDACASFVFDFKKLYKLTKAQEILLKDMFEQYGEFEMNEAFEEMGRHNVKTNPVEYLRSILKTSERSKPD